METFTVYSTPLICCVTDDAYIRQSHANQVHSCYRLDLGGSAAAFLNNFFSLLDSYLVLGSQA